jgi:hypothetical protein
MLPPSEEFQPFIPDVPSHIVDAFTERGFAG